jgi:hypothetical protein
MSGLRWPPPVADRPVLHPTVGSPATLGPLRALGFVDSWRKLAGRFRRSWGTLIVFLAIAFATFNFSALRQDVRIYIGPYPLGFADFAAALALVPVVVAVARKHSVPRDRWTVHLVVLVSYMTLVGVAVALTRHTPIYGIAQEARIVVYIATGYFAALVLMRSDTDLRIVVWVTLAFGVGIALSEIWILYSFSEAATVRSGCANPCPGAWGGGRWVRILFADPPSEALLLGSALFFFLHRFMPRPLNMALVALFGAAVVFTFSRNQWLSGAISLAGLAYLAGAARAVRPVLALVAVVTVVVGGLALSTPTFRNVYLPSIVNTVMQSGSSTDITTKERIYRTEQGLGVIFSNPLRAAFGVGYGSSSSNAYLDQTRYLDAHDGYLFFLYSGGVVGLLLVVTFLGRLVKDGWVWVTRALLEAPTLATAFAVFGVVFLIDIIVRSFVAMGIFYVQHAVYSGFVLGTLVAILAGQLISSHLDADDPSRAHLVEESVSPA